ncbi:hypothetical protein [Enterovibrio baiacu]|uniref:hypothetical protein n=1 Tax=Enterovibrio baiacu TaxID=2491023 RepID=UPI00101028EC|nr:hypothetical protein [Enterovibrio baiacu]MBE1273647.1 hypothetical protein [Enterovibrio baiacu]
MSESQSVIGPTLFMFTVIFAAFAMYFEAPAMVFYLVFVRLIYAIFVSIVIDGWKNKLPVLVETAKIRWNRNINGIPVSDTTNALVNLHFKSERELKRAFLTLLIPKAIIVVALAVLAMVNVYLNVDDMINSPLHAISIVVACYILVKVCWVFHLLATLKSSRWYLHSAEFGEDTYYSAYLSLPDTLEPYLIKVFE